MLSICGLDLDTESEYLPVCVCVVCPPWVLPLSLCAGPLCCVSATVHSSSCGVKLELHPAGVGELGEGLVCSVHGLERGRSTRGQRDSGATHSWQEGQSLPTRSPALAVTSLRTSQGCGSPGRPLDDTEGQQGFRQGWGKTSLPGGHAALRSLGGTCQSGAAVLGASLSQPSEHGTAATGLPGSGGRRGWEVESALAFLGPRVI